jgi:putative pyruvate formate lyase activating enzyme
MEKNFYSECSQCPRNCGVNRHGGEKGFCGETDGVKIASACLHSGEEPPLTVFGGSGTIFFTGCTLKCSFCQNYQISQQGMGREVDKKEFVEICMRLQKTGAENLNLVTGSHQIPRIAEFLLEAKNAGLEIPVAWNSSAYESVESLELLKGLVQIWLPDFKTINPLMSRELFLAEDYPSVAKKSIRWMAKNFPRKISVVKKGGEKKEKILQGVIVRHLVLPGRIGDTEMALDWLEKNAEGICLSIMSQYTPVQFRGKKSETEWREKSLSSFQNRLLNSDEEKKILSAAKKCSFEFLFYQELSDDTSWLPDFEKTQPFSNALAKPVWHWRDGFV